MLNRIRKSKISKVISVSLVLVILIQLFSPMTAYALTGGPSQPEVQSFQPIGTSDMVDVFSGDFSYNIPLIDVGGYPINLSYNSGITMDQEASWVGLGWNINPGVINRNMRGIPDDFDGEEMEQELNMTNNWTVGVTYGLGGELFGWDAVGLQYSLGVNFNNYEGIGFEQSLSPSISAGAGSKDELTLGLGITANNQGLNLSPSLSMSHKMKDKQNGEMKIGGSVGVNINSRAGLKTLTIGTSGSFSKIEKMMQSNVQANQDKFSLMGSNGSSSISLVNNTYVPQMNFPRTNVSLSFSIKWGGTLFGAKGSTNMVGYYSESFVNNKKKSLPAYGYMNISKGYDKRVAMLDFNREKDGAFTHNTPNLPLTNHTYDVYSISGQGVGGMFRPYRTDVGYVHDERVNNGGGGGSFGLEVGTGNAAYLGADIDVNAMWGHSGLWEKDNNALSHLNFQQEELDNPYEPWYFKQAGEKSVDDDPAFISSIGGYNPVMIDINGGPGFKSKTVEQFISPYNASPITFPSGDIKRYKNVQSGIRRVKRNQFISYLNKSESRQFGVDGYTSSFGKENHLAEIDVLRTDGARYVYGIAAYNTLQKEVSFNISKSPGNCFTGLVQYTSKDPSTNNDRGVDHFFNSTKTPAYAHSYLLTAVLSNDYVDVDNVRGPSRGDLGTYTRFDYDANPNVPGQQPAIANYRWRTPYEQNSAGFNEGLKTVQLDNKGSYVYGEKELWYLKKIETKTHIAIFHTSPRHDAHEVVSESGGLGQDAMFKLDSISLYSLPDYLKNPATALPIKRVHFRYDYTLCQGIPNNDGQMVDENGINTTDQSKNVNKGGKLTLKKVFFTYQKSFKGKLSSYAFNYADTNHDGVTDANPSYNIKGYDRWGHYKPNSTNSNCDLIAGDLPASDFPYVEQNKTTADQYAASWSLTSIKLPSGGNLEIDYESDDYAYIQDRKAMQMFKITGSGNSPSDSPTGNSALYNGTNSGSPNQYLYFQLPSGITSIADIEGDLKGKQMYFRFLMHLTESSNSPNDIEYVSGYAEVSELGLSSTSGYGYIKLKMHPNEDDNDNNICNPITKAAWQFARIYNQRLAYNQADPPPSMKLDDVVKALVNASIIKNATELFKGANSTMRAKGYGKYFVAGKSWIRLYNPNGKKLGGGVRVKEIRINDNWDKMNVNYSNNNPQDTDFDYGQQYQYVLEDGVTSSGVAAYEPLAGGDENPFRQPVFFEDKHLLAPDERNYIEEPFGESFFPSPGVGYSRVVVKNLPRYVNDNPNNPLRVKKHATGSVVHEFYTAKDFPTIVDYTPVKPIEQKTAGIGQFLKIAVRDYMTASQGYSIELNDMHGKPKSQKVYAEDQDTPISGVDYNYQTETETLPNTNVFGFPTKNKNIYRTRLNNKVLTITKNNIVSEKEVGVEVDFVTDFRESSNTNKSGSLKGNLAAFLAAILPIAVPTILPGYASEKTRFRSAVTTKVVNRYGILRETVAHDLGSQVSTENLAYDAETGEVLLTKTRNNFNDPLFSFTYPAHWGYDRMGSAYRNVRFRMSTPTIAAGGLVMPQSGQEVYLAKGDEVNISKTSGFNIKNLGKAWVWDTDEDFSNGFYLINQDGQAFNGNSAITNAVITVYRSGRRNMQTTPIGSVTSFSNPLDMINNKVNFTASTGILNAGVSEFSENWQTYCDEVNKNKIGNTTCELDYGKLKVWNQIFSYLTSNNLFCQDGMKDMPANVISDEYCFVKWVPVSSSCSSNQNIQVEVRTTASTNCVPLASYDDIQCDPMAFSLIDENLQQVTLPSGLTWNNLVSLVIKGVLPGTQFPYAIGVFSNGTMTYTGIVAVSENCGAPLNASCPQSACIPIVISCPPPPDCEPLAATKVINPYLNNVRGIWRPKRSHLYQTNRDQNIVATSSPYPTGYTNTSIRTDGKFTSYSNFWVPPSGNGSWTINNTDWTFTSEVTQNTPFGNEIENKDALNRFSGALYGYNNTLPKAVASNARYNQLAFDGFEDYDFNSDTLCCLESRFNFFTHKNMLSTDKSHTGRFSMKLSAGVQNQDKITAIRTLITAACTPAPDNMPYTVKECDLIHEFKPQTYEGAKDYIISYWVREATANNARKFDYTDVTLTVKINTSVLIPVSVQKSDIIDGWQRVEYRYTIASGASGNITVEFLNGGASGNISYIDDIRIQPFNSSMKTFVYDPKTLRLMAELDERNFATLYEYDEEGALLRVKKETEKGIMTIQESRNHNAKQ